MIYLDAAATTFQKPRAVADAIVQAMGTASNPGRGGYEAAAQAAGILFRCRSAAAELFHVPSEEQVVFTFNATHALNIAVKSLVKSGDRVVVSGYEHNAVMRPLYEMGRVRIDTAAGPLFEPEAMLRAFERAVTPDTAAVFCTHVSNVFGFVLPVEGIAEICRRRGVPLVIDASQSAGVLSLDLTETGAAFIAMPGHKGLYGPQGTGLLLCAHDTVPLIAGGTGSMSALPGMPPYLPDRLEAGTQNVPGIAGLLEGIRFVRRLGLGAIAAHERALIRTLAEQLRALPEVRFWAAEDPIGQTGVLSLQVPGTDCEMLAAWFAQRDIALRAGLHCAPLAHRTVGTFPAGTLRVSVSAFNTMQEIATFTDVLKEFLRRKSR